MDFKLGFCLSILIHTVICSPMIKDRTERHTLTEASSVEIVSIHQLTEVSRQKRDALDHVIFPSSMEFDLDFRDQKIKLRLKRHEYMTSDVHLRDENGRITHDLNRKVGLYYDIPNHGSFVVQCEDSSEQCNLRGSMLIDGEMWDIAPEMESSKLHRASPSSTNTKIMLGSDSPSLPEPSGSVSSRHDAGREKRDIPTQCQIVECLAIVDESIWEYYFNKTGRNTTAAEEAIAAYFLALYTQADIHFNYINIRRNDTCMRLYLAGVVIQKNTSVSWSSPNELSISGADIAYVEAIGGLLLCGDQGNALRTSFSMDVMQCFTRKDIVWNENSGQPLYFDFYRSLGFRGVCCDPQWSIYQGSVIEAYGDLVEVVIAHEIGRSLNARDDPDAGCIDEDDYIMAREVVINSDSLKYRNLWYFSTCSVDEMYSYISTQPTCLSTNAFNSTQFDFFDNQPIAGTLFDLSEQCEARFGNGSVFCDPTGRNRTFYDDMCGAGIFCTEVEFGNGSCTGVTRPFDGSPCGTFGSFCSVGSCIIRKGLGENCTAHTDCSAANATCSYPNNTCVCAPGYYDNDGSTVGGECLEKVAVGQACPQPDACLDANAVCDNGNCTCISGYYTENRACFQLKCLGESCSASYQCLGNDTECLGTPSTCRCPSDRYFNVTNGNCDIKKELGIACEDGECGPANSVCSSTSNVCVCQDGFFDTDGTATPGGNCTAKLDLGVACTQSDSCADPVGICSGTCQCPSDFFNNNGTCERKKCVGESCFNTTDCLGTNVECLGSPKLCQCPTGFYLNDTTADCDMKKDLGRTCEDGECGPANSVCSSTSNVCECQAGFFDTDGAATPGGNCTAKLGLGVACTQPDSCADPVGVCSGTCQCPSDFFNNNGSCERKKCVGESCFNTTDCLGTNVECLGNPKLCQCPTGFYLNDTTADCDMKKDLGRTCEDGECGPTNSVCGSTSNVCECQAGFFDTDGATTPGGNCTAKLGLGVACTQPDSCVDPVGLCSTTCQCPSDFFNNNGTCERKKCVGESCFNTTDCLGTNVECLGSPKLCQCPTGFYLNDTTADCDMKKDLGRTCEDGECGPANSVCSSTSNVCECQEGFFDTDGATTPGGNCTAKLGLGVACTQSDSCADTVGICSTTCQCPSDFFNNNGTCERKKCVGESCFNTTDCLGTNVECLGSPKLCQCPTGFYLNDTTADCDMKKDLGRTCEDGECGPANSVCSSTSNVCECQEGFFDTDGAATPGGNCTAKLGLGVACTQSDSCADPVGLCSTTCQCPSDFFNNNGTCERKKCVGESCFNTTDCLGTNVECLGSPKLCQCPTGFYLNDTTADCDMKKDLGRICEDGECGPANSVCSSTSNVCECQEGFFDTDGAATPGGNCTAKLFLGVACTQSDSCADPVGLCSTTCQCPSDFFNNNGTCERKKCVGESCFNTTDCLGANVECLGSPKLCQCPTGFYLNDTTADCDMKKDLGRTCEDGECGPANSVCSSTSNVCECQEGFFDTDGAATPGGNCTAKLGLGVACTQLDSCADPVGICSTTCQCPSDFFNNNGTCERKKCVGESCLNTTDCLGTNVECLGSPKLCQCPTGFYLNDTTADCDMKKDLGRTCEDGECGPANSVCSSTSNVCECQEGFFDTDGAATPGGNCTAKLGLGVACTQSDSCADPVGICSTTCQCPSDFFNNNGTCERKKCVGEPCANVSACLSANAECSGTPTTICQCPTGFYLNDTTSDCDTRLGLGSVCSGDQCADPNAVCNPLTGSCRCAEGYLTNGTVCIRSCPLGGWEQFNNSCYYYGEVELFNQAARDFCDRYDNDIYESSLVQVDTTSELNYLKNFMLSRTLQPAFGYWNDLFQNTTNGVDEYWRSSGDPLVVADWGTGEPNLQSESCTFFLKSFSYKQADVNCANPNNPTEQDATFTAFALCEVELGSVIPP